MDNPKQVIGEESYSPALLMVKIPRAELGDSGTQLWKNVQGLSEKGRRLRTITKTK
jgi:hypothetical protein